MPNRDVVVIGASAGGFEVLKQLFRALPADFPAAVLVVLHLGEHGYGSLVKALDAAGPLRVSFAEDGRRIENGAIALAPPNEHLLLAKGVMLLRRGPRENGSRPAIDPLFRSAAVHYGTRAIGMVLSGMLSDGALGLGAIKRCGGLAVVQDPADAAFPDMPEAALAAKPDHVASLAELPDLLSRLVAEAAPLGLAIPEDIRIEAAIAAGEKAGIAVTEQLGERSVLSCPECHGVLWEIGEGSQRRFRCHVGHGFSEASLEREQASEMTQALVSALRALEERVMLVGRLGESADQARRSSLAKHWHERAAEYQEQADLIRRILRQGSASEPEATGRALPLRYRAS